jgi:hypothetical protein
LRRNRLAERVLRRYNNGLSGIRSESAIYVQRAGALAFWRA